MKEVKEESGASLGKNVSGRRNYKGKVSEEENARSIRGSMRRLG